MIFEWDPAKSASNLKKHGFDFETAQYVFNDPLALVTPDLGTHGEQRWNIIGKVNDSLLAFVVYLVHEGDVEVYRIVSARRVTAYERKEYEKS